MKKGYVYILLSAVAFSTMEIAGKIVAKNINPFQLTFLRFLIGGLFLFPFAIKDIIKRGLKLRKNDYLFFLWTGFLCVIISMTFFQLAIVYTKASTVAILFSTNPIFTIPFAYFLLHEKLTLNTILSLIFSFVGIIFILNPLKINTDIKGISLAILAAITFSLYSVVGKLRSKKYGSIALNSFTFLTGDLLLLIYMFISNTEYIRDISIKYSFNAMYNIHPFLNLDSKNIVTIMYLGIVVTGIGYLLFFLAMEETSAAIASVVFFIKPALAPLLSFIILRENIPNNTLIGIVFILIGSFISFIKKANA